MRNLKQIWSKDLSVVIYVPGQLFRQRLQHLVLLFVFRETYHFDKLFFVANGSYFSYFFDYNPCQWHDRQRLHYRNEKEVAIAPPELWLGHSNCKLTDGGTQTTHAINDARHRAHSSLIFICAVFADIGRASRCNSVRHALDKHTVEEKRDHKDCVVQLAVLNSQHIKDQTAAYECHESWWTTLRIQRVTNKTNGPRSDQAADIIHCWYVGALLPLETNSS